MPDSASAPGQEYARRLESARTAIASLDARHRMLGNTRLAIALVAVAIGWFAIGQRAISPWWLVPPVATFIVLAVVHESVVRRKARAARVAAFYEQGLARIEDRWMGRGEGGERFEDPAHPYASDLDLFGHGGLFELLSVARTRIGENCLARWLLEAAVPSEVRERQESVADLRERLDMREEIAVLGGNSGVSLHPERLIQWAESPLVLNPGLLRVAAFILPILLSVFTIAYLAAGWRLPLLVSIVAEGSFVMWLQPRATRVLGEVEQAAVELEVLAELLARLEQERFHSARLIRLAAVLELQGRSPSKQIARLRRIKEVVESRDSLAVRPLRPFTLWGTQAAFAAERWRRDSGRLVRPWLDAVGEIEALNSLAGYAFEHPAHPFPELADEPQGVFEGTALSHPLLAESRSVANDVTLNREMRLMLVSGSNMSGKSTLLRTVGINAVLAMAGAPVSAKRLRLSPLKLGVSIRVTDSLQAGASRFYAEITRLRQILDLTGSPPAVLFLLDELLHGTNSHDRRIGAEAIVRGLVERGAMGLVTTHDLALAAIVETLGGSARNVHFEDQIENGRMTFNYRLQPGMVTKSNAIELMRSVGLPL
ncbi:MAG: hypothetical protein IT160_13065 [Bryobacterales bacterium]|nr:hypothetical protein [Bryobacterales bacterium]